VSHVQQEAVVDEEIYADDGKRHCGAEETPGELVAG